MTKTDQNMNYQNMLSISVIWQSSIICKLFVAFSVAVRFVFSLLSTRQKQPPEVFYRKWSSWKFRKIHGKILVTESLFKWSCRPSARKFIKKETPRPANLFKKETMAQVISCEFCKIFKSIFFYRTHPVATS